MAFDVGLCTTSGTLNLLSGDESCINTIDQTGKLAFAPLTQTGFTIETAPTTDIDLAAAWAAQLAAGLRLSPPISQPNFEPGDYQEDADEGNIDGIPQHLGTGYSTFTGVFKNVPSALVAKLENLTVLTSKVAGVTQYGVYFLGRNNRITATSSGDKIPIFNFAIKDVMTEGKGKPNAYEFRFLLKEDWSKDIKTFVAADFNPLTLVNPVS